MPIIAGMNEIDNNLIKPSMPHPINLPVTEMGRQLDGINIKPEQEKVLRGSPQTEASLSILGAGSPYGGNNGL